MPLIEELPVRPEAFAEFEHMGAHGAGLHLCDHDGRPLGERNAPAHLVEGLKTDDKVSSYPEREGALMNMAGLKQVMSAWKPAIELIREIRHWYVSVADVDSFSVADLWNISRIFTSVPSYLHYRRDNPVEDGSISVPIAAAYKMGGGPFLPAAKYIGSADNPNFSSQMDAKTFLDITEKSGTFNLHGATCAAAPSLVLAFLEEIINPTENASEGVCRKNGIDQSSFMSYALHSLVLDYIKIEVAAELSQLNLELLNRSIHSNKTYLPCRSDVEKNLKSTGWMFGLGRLMTGISKDSVFCIDSSEKTSQFQQRIITDCQHHRAILAKIIKVMDDSSACLSSLHLHDQSRSNSDKCDKQIYTVADIDLAEFINDLETKKLLEIETYQGAVNRSLGWSTPNLSFNTFRTGIEIILPSTLMKSHSPERLTESIGKN